jgi:hypothetical protein
MLDKNPRGVLVFREELTAWVASMNQYRGGKGADRQFWLSRWSGEPVKIDRKGNSKPRTARRDSTESEEGVSTFIPAPYVSVLGGLQPDVLADLMTAGGDDGFRDRMLLAVPALPPAMYWTDETISPELMAAWDVTFSALSHLPMPDEKAVQVSMSPEAREAYIAWHDGLIDEINSPLFPEYLNGFYGKMKAHVARFALVLHYLNLASKEDWDREDTPVSVEAIRGAIELSQYFKSHFQVALRESESGLEKKQLTELIQWMWRGGRCGEVTARQVSWAKVPGLPGTIREVRNLFAVGQAYACGVYDPKKDTFRATVKNAEDAKRATLPDRG